MLCFMGSQSQTQLSDELNGIEMVPRKTSYGTEQTGAFRVHVALRTHEQG